LMSPLGRRPECLGSRLGAPQSRNRWLGRCGLSSHYTTNNPHGAGRHPPSSATVRDLARERRTELLPRESSNCPRRRQRSTLAVQSGTHRLVGMWWCRLAGCLVVPAPGIDLLPRSMVTGAVVDYHLRRRATTSADLKPYTINPATLRSASPHQLPFSTACGRKRLGQVPKATTVLRRNQLN
jgi:hypothetical protein